MMVYNEKTLYQSMGIYDTIGLFLLNIMVIAK